MRSAVRNCRVESRQMTRLTSRSARRAAMSSKLMPERRRAAPTRPVVVVMIASHGGDELLDALIHAAVRVLAQHSALGLIVELEVHPVDGEIPPLLLRLLDEVTAQLGTSRLRRHTFRLECREIRDDSIDRAAVLEEIEKPTGAGDVVVGEIKLSHPRR